MTPDPTDIRADLIAAGLLIPTPIENSPRLSRLELPPDRFVLRLDDAGKAAARRHTLAWISNRRAELNFFAGGGADNVFW